MNVIPHVVAASCLLAAVSHAQTIPNLSTISTRGTFRNVSGESAASTFLIDDQLDDGYVFGSDLFSGPTALMPTAARGNAFFQWGTPESAGDHAGALWFQQNFSSNVQLERPFTVGSIFFRNGSITEGSGITGFDLEMSLARPGISLPNNLNPMVASYHVSLLDTPGADTLVLQETLFETPFVDANGKVYFLKIGFSDPLDNAPVPNVTSFSVGEGSVGQMHLTGVFTTVPEPSAAVLGVLGVLGLLRRRR